jgi:hypothetical protein
MARLELLFWGAAVALYGTLYAAFPVEGWIILRAFGKVIYQFAAFSLVGVLALVAAALVWDVGSRVWRALRG